MTKLNRIYIFIVIIFMLAPAKAYTQNKNDKLISFDKQLSFLEDKLGSYPPKLQPQERIEIERKLYKLIKELDKLGKLNPTSSEIEWRIGACYKLGYNLDLEGAWKKAESHLNNAIKLDPNSIEAHIELGVLYVNTDISLANKAEKIFLKAIELNEKKYLFPADSGLIFAYYYQGKFDKAVEQADRCLSFDPENYSAQELRKSALKKIATGTPLKVFKMKRGDEIRNDGFSPENAYKAKQEAIKLGGVRRKTEKDIVLYFNNIFHFKIYYKTSWKEFSVQDYNNIEKICMLNLSTPPVTEPTGETFPNPSL